MKGIKIILFVLVFSSVLITNTAYSKIEKIFDDLHVHQGDVIDEEVAVIFGDALIEGEVMDEIVVVHGDLILKSTAVIYGDIVVVSGRIEREDGSQVFGSINHLKNPLRFHSGHYEIHTENDGPSGPIVYLLLISIPGLLFVLIASNFSLRTEETLKENTGMSILYGLGAAFVFFPLWIISFITIIGIVVVPVFFYILHTAGVFIFLNFLFKKGLKNKKNWVIYSLSFTVFPIVFIIANLINFLLLNFVVISFLIFATVTGSGAILKTFFDEREEKKLQKYKEIIEKQQKESYSSIKNQSRYSYSDISSDLDQSMKPNNSQPLNDDSNDDLNEI